MKYLVTKYVYDSELYSRQCAEILYNTLYTRFSYYIAKVVFKIKCMLYITSPGQPSVTPSRCI